VTRILIYLFPAMIDMVLGSVLFVGSVRMAASEASPEAVANVLTVWALVYMVCCPVVGRIVTPGNAWKMIVGSSLCIAVSAVLFIYFPGLKAIYVITAIQAVGTAFFFTPFQVFMKQVQHGQSTGIVRSTALYTFAWSAGIATGPFVAGYIWELSSWKWCHALNSLLAASTALGIILLRHLAHEKHAPKETTCSRPQPDYSAMPDLAWLGWVAAGIGCMVVALLRAVFPSSAKLFEITKPQQGTTLALLGWAQAVTGLLMGYSRTWMYRALPVAVLSLFGLGGVILFAAADRPAIFYAGAVCVGIYSGMFFFYLVFHSLVHPSRSARYISINESVVGLTGIIGPLIGGRIAGLYNLSTPYYFAAVLVFGAIMLQVVVKARYARQVSEVRATVSQSEPTGKT